MSRCFSFPPPGYELKARPDDVNLIIKDKQKHKKQKDKKEKDKKEGSERKEKEKSENKHKEDKKRKQKEDKVKKDKHKDEQSSLGVFLENQNGQKLVPDFVKLGKVQENGNDTLAVKDKREHNRMVSDQSLSFWELDKVEKKMEGTERNGYRAIVGDADDSKNGDQIKITEVDEKKMKEDKHHIKKEEKKKRKEAKKKRKEEKKKRKEEKKKREEEKKKNKENSDCQGKLPKLEEVNDFLDAEDNGVRPAIVSHNHKAGHTGGGIRPSKNTINLGVSERAASMDQKVNPKLSSPQSVIDGVRNIGTCPTANNRKTESCRVNVNNHVVSNGVISPHIFRIERKVDPYQSSNGVGITKHIVNRSANGIIPSSHQFAENERKMATQAPDAFHKIMHSKESGMNDSLEGKRSSSSMPSSTCLKGKDRVATITKPPHPDLKYLSQILAVPEVEWPQCDDQEWLLPQSKRPKLASSEIQWTKQVWSEAVELECADVTALPYVIPY